MPRYQFVTNLYQAFGLSFISVLSQDVPATRFFPQSAQSLVDISAARAASEVSTLVEQNNHAERLLTNLAFFLWTDGKVGGYVRYVADGPRFGWHDEPNIEPIEIALGPDYYVCPQCGTETPAPTASQPSLDLAAEQNSVTLNGAGLRRRSERIPRLRPAAAMPPTTPTRAAPLSPAPTAAPRSRKTTSAPRKKLPSQESPARAALPTARK